MRTSILAFMWFIIGSIFTSGHAASSSQSKQDFERPVVRFTGFSGPGGKNEVLVFPHRDAKHPDRQYKVVYDGPLLGTCGCVQQGYTVYLSKDCKVLGFETSAQSGMAGILSSLNPPQEEENVVAGQLHYVKFTQAGTLKLKKIKAKIASLPLNTRTQWAKSLGVVNFDELIDSKGEVNFFAVAETKKLSRDILEDDKTLQKRLVDAVYGSRPQPHELNFVNEIIALLPQQSGGSDLIHLPIPQSDLEHLQDYSNSKETLEKSYTAIADGLKNPENLPYAARVSEAYKRNTNPNGAMGNSVSTFLLHLSGVRNRIDECKSKWPLYSGDRLPGMIEEDLRKNQHRI